MSHEVQRVPSAFHLGRLRRQYGAPARGDEMAQQLPYSLTLLPPSSHLERLELLLEILGG